MLPSQGALDPVPDRRFEHTAVWTGAEMIVWGGRGTTSFLDTGLRYDPDMGQEIVLHATSDVSKFMVVRFGNVLESRGSIVPLTSGRQVRDFVHVYDVAKAFATFADREVGGRREGGRVHGEVTGALTLLLLGSDPRSNKVAL